MLDTLFAGRRERRERARMQPLYDAVVAAGRDPGWFVHGGVPDTVDGRFETIALTLSLVLQRMEDSAALRPASVWLTELFIADMDGQLRESGIGDVVVGKHMGRMMAALGGRHGAYREALESGDGARMAEALRRNLLAHAPAGETQMSWSAERIRHLRAALDRLDDDALLRGDIGTALAGKPST